MFLAMLGIGLVIPILPELLKEFGAGGKAAGYLVSAFGLTQFLFSPIAGEFSDKYGRKPMIVVGLCLFVISNLLAAVADHFSLFLVSRLIGGMGSAALVPSIMAYVVDITTEEQRPRAMSFLGASMSSGFIIGPGLGGLLAEFGTRAPFFGSASIGLLSVICCLPFLPESQSVEARHMHLKSKPKKENIFRQLAQSVKSRYFTLLLMIFALTFGLTHFEAIYPLFVTQSYGFTTREISILFMVCSLIGTFNQVMLTNRLTQRFGEKPIISSMLLLSAISLVFLLFSGNFFYVMVITMLFFTFNNILRPTINTLLSKEAGNEQGFVAGLNNAYMGLGQIFGPVLAGWLFDIHINLPYLFGAFVLLVSSFVSVKWVGSKNGESPTENKRLNDQAL
ncbi:MULTISPECIES: MFS transporter [Neobacillus]|uniref:MFS transporter n=1 Tax=Neobacillus rhizophilus TaxID=2833579 RepID=A0A942YT55_9BACI|nr:MULTISPECIES: MFS transporter [Neobacillus]MBS4211542.1 MFS transporter [Neobacillus rhizophilus]MBU8916959.1 MFS transporter [Bacillus sp. FJAT-29953]